MLCKFKYRDYGTIQSALGPGPLQTRNFNQPSDTHEIDGSDFYDWPGLDITFKPFDDTMPFHIVYDLTVTASCEGYDGSNADDSKHIGGDYTGTVTFNSGGGVQVK